MRSSAEAGPARQEAVQDRVCARLRAFAWEGFAAQLDATGWVPWAAWQVMPNPQAASALIVPPRISHS